jgi:hypothetical protein
MFGEKAGAAVFSPNIQEEFAACGSKKELLRSSGTFNLYNCSLAVRSKRSTLQKRCLTTKGYSSYSYQNSRQILHCLLSQP